MVSLKVWEGQVYAEAPSSTACRLDCLELGSRLGEDEVWGGGCGGGGGEVAGWLAGGGGPGGRQQHLHRRHRVEDGGGTDQVQA